MTSKTVNAFILIIVILAGSAAAVYLTDHLETIRPSMTAAYEDDDLALEASRMKGYLFGAEGLGADWYWMNSLQYIGGKIQKVGLDRIDLDDMSNLNPRLLYPYLNNTVDLDPRFIAAYTYGATVLPAIDVDQAISLTEKGIEKNPDSWRLYQYLGYIHWRQKDYERASEAYAKGAQIPGSAQFMREMAAAMRSRGGSRDTAREMYYQIASESQDQRSKENAELRLLELDSLDERDAINTELSKFRERAQRCPETLSEILPQIRTLSLPQGRAFLMNRQNEIVDPTGIPYAIDKASCKAMLGRESRIPRSYE